MKHLANIFLAALFLVAMPFSFIACSDDDPIIEENVLSQADILGFLAESEFVSGEQIPLRKNGSQWEHGIPLHTHEGMDYLNFYRSFTNKYFWYKEGQLYIDVPFLAFIRGKELSWTERSAFSSFMTQRFPHGLSLFIPVSLYFDEVSQQFSTTEKAFDSEENPGIKFVLESFKFGTLIIRTEYSESYGGNDGSRASYKKTTPPTEETYMFFNRKQEVYEYLDQLFEEAMIYAKENGLFPTTD